MGWVKSMPGDFGEFSVNIGLGINFLAGGTLFFNSNDTLSYQLSQNYEKLIVLVASLDFV